MERDVLEGARATISRHQPLLYVENNKPERSKDLIAWLLANHYRPYWHLPPFFNPKNHFGETKNVFGITISANMLCVPKSKPSRVEGLQRDHLPRRPLVFGLKENRHPRRAHAKGVRKGTAPAKAGEGDPRSHSMLVSGFAVSSLASTPNAASA